MSAPRFQPLAAALCALVMVAGPVAAQEYGDRYVDEASPFGVAVGVRFGGVMSTARGTFPSLIVADTAAGSTEGSGEIPEAYAQSGGGYRIGIHTMIPIVERIGFALELGTQRYSAEYRGDDRRLPTRLEIQSLQLLLGGEAALFCDPAAVTGKGLRSVYTAIGFDITVATLANRVESTAWSDSAATQPLAAVGTFENNEAFNTLVAFRGGVGIRFAADTHLELSAEAGYSVALSNLFSPDALPDSDFTVDNLVLVAGVGYRF